LFPPDFNYFPYEELFATPAPTTAAPTTAAPIETYITTEIVTEEPATGPNRFRGLMSSSADEIDKQYEIEE